MTFHRSRSRRTRARRARGLTLIEVGLAVAILAIMAALTWGTIARSFDAFETVSDIDQRYHNVRVAMGRMTRELSMAYLTSVQRHGGKERMWVTHFKSKREGDFQRLDFTSFAHEILRADAKESDQCEIGYFGEKDPDDRERMNLVRREDPRPDREPDKGGRVDVLAEAIEGFKVRFFDDKKDDWTDVWDTEDAEFAGRLPPIVELTIIAKDESGKDVPFVTKTRINLTRELGKI